MKQNGREVEILANGNSEQLLDELQAHQPEELRCESLSLEEIFVASKTLSHQSRMNALVEKEIRLLLPSFLIGVALTFANCFLKTDQLGFNTFVSVVSITSCSAIAVFMALSSFGAEISSGTFSMLLSQPVSRRRIWRTKTLLLAAALFIGGCLWCAILYLRFEVFNHPEGLGDFGDIFLGTWLFLMVIYSGALWTVLLFRQMTAAFWFTLLVPVAIFVAIATLVKNDDAGTTILSIVFALYSVAGYLFARRLFLRAQDVQWTGGTISLPAWLGFGGQTISTVRRPRRSLSALVRKEFQLHQVSILLAIILAVLDLIWIVLLRIRPGLFSDRSAGEIIILGSFGLFWFALPWLIGSLAVAEERRLGTLEAQLCMPVTRRFQLFVKCAVALILAISLGVLLPWCLERIAALIGVNAEIFRRGLFENGLATRTIACAALVAISCYASTLARHALQTMGIAVVLTTVAWLLIVSVARGYLVRAWMAPIIFFIGFPVMLAGLIWLTYTNYKCLLEGWRTWSRNFFTLTVLLVSAAIVANAIYYRAWELVLPLEPHHGPTRLSQPQHLTLHATDNIIAVHLPDGRVWLDPVGVSHHTNALIKLLSQDHWPQEVWPVDRNQEHFVTGSNWTAIAANWRVIVGTQNDGTLWCLSTAFTNSAGLPLRIGAESNWQQVALASPGFMLLKKDGSLWGWGANEYSVYRTNLQAVLAAPPFRIGSESDWAEITPCGRQALVRSKDGRFWAWQYFYVKGKDESLFFRRPDLDQNDWLSLSPEQWLGATNRLCAGVRADGTLWLWLNSFPKDHPDEIIPNQKIQVGKDHQWQSVSINGQELFALERNGTLWKWKPVDEWKPIPGSADYYHFVIAESAPVQLGNHSDWMAVSPGRWGGGVISLAADGSIWRWSDYPSNPLFVPSRRPEKIANIFSGSP